MQRTDISAFVAEAAADVPERQALVESGGRTLTWAALEDEVASRPAWARRGSAPDSA